jgi:hypothetical protein
MIYYYSLFTLFAIVAIMIVIDPNVGAYIVLLTKILKVNIERMYWMIRFHPAIISSPIGRWWMMRKYMRTVEKLSQELPHKGEEVL